MLNVKNPEPEKYRVGWAVKNRANAGDREPVSAKDADKYGINPDLLSKDAALIEDNGMVLVRTPVAREERLALDRDTLEAERAEAQTKALEEVDQQFVKREEELQAQYQKEAEQEAQSEEQLATVEPTRADGTINNSAADSEVTGTRRNTRRGAEGVNENA